jgi:SAM-dependent methyltransferase
MPAAAFDDLSDVYDAMIDWPKRLAHEAAFYRRLFERVGCQSVLDVACGTGRHAAMFHQWRLRVEAADLSPQMIARARQNYGEPAGLCWVVRGFDQPVAASGPFDVALCVGNSLALAPDAATVERALGQMLSAVRPGGAVLVQVLNLWRLSEGPCLWQKCQRTVLPQGETLIVKGVHRCGRKGYVELIVSGLTDPAPWRSDAVSFLGLEVEELTQMVLRAGGGSATFFGGYQEQPYERSQSVDLILVANK